MTQTPDFIPWNAINDRYNWAARDSDGIIRVHECRPELSSHRFCRGGNSKRIDTLTTARAGNCEWQHSLQSRP